MMERKSDRLLLWLTLALAALFLVLLYREVFAYFIPRWFKEQPYYHCSLVPLIVGWLIWRQRDQLSRLRATATPSGLLLLTFGLLVYIIGARTGVRLVVGTSLPLVLLGLCASLAGWPVLKRLAIPLLLTFFLIPVPRHVLGYVAFPMQIISARATAFLGRLSGLAVVTHGVNMDLQGFRFEVAQECSGLNSLLALLLATAVLAEIMGLSLARKLLLLAIAPIIVLAANIVRLLSVLWISKFISPQVALNGLVHGTSDLIVYSVAVIFVLLIIGLLGDKRSDTSSPETPLRLQGQPRGT